MCIKKIRIFLIFFSGDRNFCLRNPFLLHLYLKIERKNWGQLLCALCRLTRVGTLPMEFSGGSCNTFQKSNGESATLLCFAYPGRSDCHRYFKFDKNNNFKFQNNNNFKN